MTLFRTRSKCMLSCFKAIALHPANQIDRAGNTLLIRTGCLGQTRAKLYTLFSLEQRGQKSYPVQRAHPRLGHMS